MAREREEMTRFGRRRREGKRGNEHEKEWEERWEKLWMDLRKEGREESIQERGIGRAGLEGEKKGAYKICLCRRGKGGLWREERGSKRGRRDAKSGILGDKNSEKRKCERRRQ